MKNNEDISMTVVDCTVCPLRNDRSTCKCLNCFSRVEKALSIKDTNIKLAIKEVIAHYNKETENNNTSTIAKAMSMLKQKLNLED